MHKGTRANLIVVYKGKSMYNFEKEMKLPLQKDELLQMDEYIHHQKLLHSYYHLHWPKDQVKYTGIGQDTILSISMTFCTCKRIL